jgi:glycosyltransferase involved in cell wall biosynthesis
VRKLLINRKVVSGPWGGGNGFVRALHEHAERYGFEVVHTLQNGISAILVVDPRLDPEIGYDWTQIAQYKRLFPSTLVVHRLNECDQRKGDVNVIDPLLRSMAFHADVRIFISQWLKDHHRRGGMRVDESDPVIINGVDAGIFHPGEKESSEKLSLVTHHWSPHVMKGADVYRALGNVVSICAPGAGERSLSFTYVGRASYEIPGATIVAPLSGKDLGDELRRHDIYISASRFDPGPNHVAEAIASGLPTLVHRDGGGAVEMAGASHVYTDFEDLLEKLSQGVSKNPTVIRDWSNVIDDYFKVIVERL